MQFKFRLFLQQHQDASVTLRVPVLPNLQTYHADRAQAIADMAAEIIQYVRGLERHHWGRLVFVEDQQLRPLSLELTPKVKPPQEPIPITLNLLVSAEPQARGPRYVATAPRLPGLHVVVERLDLVEPKAREAVLYLTRKWDSQAILALDLSGPEELLVIEVELPEGGQDAADEPLSNTYSQENVLGLCGLSLSAQARRGKLGRADRREALAEMLITSLATERSSSVMLVGKAGVGKTALLHELVERINSGRVPASLKGREVWFITANNLIAGMKYTGEWQGRTQKLIEQVRRGRQILYMADPNEILDAGRWTGSDNNMGRFLRPYLESGELTLICECAPEGFAAGLRVEPSFMHAFRRIDVAETDEAETHTILQLVARRLEAALSVAIDPAATGAILDLTRRFMPYRAFPGKAVSFLEEMIHDAAATAAHAERGIAGRGFGRADVITSFTQKTGLPALMLSDEADFDLGVLRSYFEERLLGQPEAVEAMVDLITVIKAGLNDPNKPLGSFFFVGPTGVGKTELAKVLAEFLFGSRERMLRFDMSEYAASDALPRLIGAAWKPDSEGELTRRVREQPFCVVLFDELEKAHAEVYDALLGVLGEGRMSDASGRTADFRNTIIIMTSNLGASRREMQSIGFRDAADDAADTARLYDHFVKEAERFFRPEFFNRIDRIVAFRPLTLDAMRLITRRELGKLLMREGVVRRNLLVEIDDAVIEQLLQQGFHPLYGARPLQREIERAVILPLARLVLQQGADLGSLLRFSVRPDASGAEHIHLSLVPLDLPEDLPDAALPGAPPPDRRLEHNLASILRAVAELREQLASEEASPVVQQLRREVSRLLLRTREPSFWDQPGPAREVLSRVYHLERVLKRLDSLAERAEFLEEKSRQIRAHRDRRSLPALAREVEALHGEFSYLQLELAGAAVGRGLDTALLRIMPLSKEAEDWAAQLVAMYSAWAGRKGYEHTLVDLGPSGDGAERRYQGPALPPAIFLRGSYVYEFLTGEAGLHKLNPGSDDARRRILARVSVLPVADDLDEDNPVRLRAALSNVVVRAAEGASTRSESVARVYNQGRHRFVRDPRTGVRLTDLAAVLNDGQLDPFLLASLRQRATGGTF
jgi:ATP-dependent Clp protease ATP-binding subunit ClpA/protein subunit release factor A